MPKSSLVKIRGYRKYSKRKGYPMYKSLKSKVRQLQRLNAKEKGNWRSPESETLYNIWGVPNNLNVRYAVHRAAFTAYGHNAVIDNELPLCVSVVDANGDLSPDFFVEFSSTFGKYSFGG
jgi:hypothetical protein